MAVRESNCELQRRIKNSDTTHPFAVNPDVVIWKKKLFRALKGFWNQERNWAMAPICLVLGLLKDCWAVWAAFRWISHRWDLGTRPHGEGPCRASGHWRRLGVPQSASRLSSSLASMNSLQFMVLRILNVVKVTGICGNCAFPTVGALWQFWAATMTPISGPDCIHKGCDSDSRVDPTNTQAFGSQCFQGGLGAKSASKS